MELLERHGRGAGTEHVRKERDPRFKESEWRMRLVSKSDGVR